jgi:hypothetical protein
MYERLLKVSLARDGIFGDAMAQYKIMLEDKRSKNELIENEKDYFNKEIKF